MRKYWLAILQGIISLLLLWHLFSNEALRVEASRLLAAADPRWLAAGLCAALLNETFAAVRWWFVLRAFGTPVGLGRVFAFCAAGIFFSLGLPGTAGGDAFRILYVMRLYPEKKLSASLSVLADRLCGLVPLALALATSVILRNGLNSLNTQSKAIFLAAIVALGGTIVLVFLWWLTTLPKIRDLWVPNFLTHLKQRVSHLGHLFTAIKSRPELIVIGILASFAAMISHFTTYLCSAHAFGLSVNLGDVFIIMPVVDTLVAIPVSLFGIGLRETLFQQLLGSMYGVPGGAAALASLGGFGIQASVSLLGGLLIPFTTPNVDCLLEERGES